MKIFLMLLLSSLVYASCSVQADNNLVFDMSRKRLQTGVDYFILPYNVTYGGGLSLAATRDKTCPLEVVLHVERYDDEIPVTFHQVLIKSGGIHESTDLEIKFKGKTNCGRSTFMKLDNYDKLRKRYYVVVGGQQDKHDSGSTKSWFKIKKYKDNYKLMYCPTVCRTCKGICKDVGVYDDDSMTYSVFALSDKPQMVMFRRA